MTRTDTYLATAAVSSTSAAALIGGTLGAGVALAVVAAVACGLGVLAATPPAAPPAAEPDGQEPDGTS